MWKNSTVTIILKIKIKEIQEGQAATCVCLPANPVILGGFGNTLYHSHYAGPNPKDMVDVEPCGFGGS